MEKERIDWINGLKGLACLMVFFHHYVISYYPACYTGLDTDSRTVSGIDMQMGLGPLGVISNGNFAVAIFIMISSFLFARKVMNATIADKKLDLFTICLKRYFRLMLNVAFTGLVLYVLFHVFIILNISYPSFIFELEFRNLIPEILIYQWITLSTKVYPVFWTMEIFLFGSFIAMFLAAWSNKKRWYMPIIYLIIAYPMTRLFVYHITIVLGVVLADIACFDRLKGLKFFENKVVCNIVGIVLLIIGIFLGGYPSGHVALGTPYEALYNISSNFNGDDMVAIVHGIAAFFVLTGLYIKKTNYILLSKPFKFMGDNSFGIYVVHGMVIILLTSKIQPLIKQLTNNYHSSVWISFVFTVIVVMLFAVLYQKFVDGNINKLVNKFVNKSK